MRKAKALVSILFLLCLLPSAEALPAHVEASATPLCLASKAIPGAPQSAVVNFTGFGPQAKPARASATDRYEFGSAANVLMVLDAEDISLNGQPVALEAVPQKLGMLHGPGKKAMTLKVLIDEEASYSLVHQIIGDINAANICDFSIRNMRFYYAFGMEDQLPNFYEELYSPKDIPGYASVITASTVGLMKGKLGQALGGDADSECSVFYNRGKVSSTELFDILQSRISRQQSKASGASGSGPTNEKVLTQSIFVQAPASSPWRCVAGVLWNVKKAGYGAATLRIMPD